MPTPILLPRTTDTAVPALATPHAVDRGSVIGFLHIPLAVAERATCPVVDLTDPRYADAPVFTEAGTNNGARHALVLYDAATDASVDNVDLKSEVQNRMVLQKPLGELAIAAGRLSASDAWLGRACARDPVAEPYAIAQDVLFLQTMDQNPRLHSRDAVRAITTHGITMLHPLMLNVCGLFVVGTRARRVLSHFTMTCNAVAIPCRGAAAGESAFFLLVATQAIAAGEAVEASLEYALESLQVRTYTNTMNVHPAYAHWSPCAATHHVPARPHSVASLWDGLCRDAVDLAASTRTRVGVSETTDPILVGVGYYGLLHRAISLARAIQMALTQCSYEVATQTFYFPTELARGITTRIRDACEVITANLCVLRMAGDTATQIRTEWVHTAVTRALLCFADADPHILNHGLARSVPGEMARLFWERCGTMWNACVCNVDTRRAEIMFSELGYIV